MEDFGWVDDIPTNDITDGTWIIDISDCSRSEKNGVQRILFSKGFSWSSGHQVVLNSMSGDGMKAYILHNKIITWGYGGGEEKDGINYIHSDSVLTMKR
jgi:hypothetical protein